jgi:hypothetical protein
MPSLPGYRSKVTYLDSHAVQFRPRILALTRASGMHHAQVKSLLE